MPDALNDILVQCALLRNCYPLMHRTLFEFAEFCSAAIWGPVGDVVWSDRDSATRICERFRDRYQPGDDELILLATAFLEYCREEYADPTTDPTP